MKDGGFRELHFKLEHLSEGWAKSLWNIVGLIIVDSFSHADNDIGVGKACGIRRMQVESLLKGK